MNTSSDAVRRMVGCKYGSAAIRPVHRGPGCGNPGAASFSTASDGEITLITGCDEYDRVSSNDPLRGRVVSRGRTMVSSSGFQPDDGGFNSPPRDQSNNSKPTPPPVTGRGDGLSSFHLICARTFSCYRTDKKPNSRQPVGLRTGPVYTPVFADSRPETMPESAPRVVPVSEHHRAGRQDRSPSTILTGEPSSQTRQHNRPPTPRCAGCAGMVVS